MLKGVRNWMRKKEDVQTPEVVEATETVQEAEVEKVEGIEEITEAEIDFSESNKDSSVERDEEIMGFGKIKKLYHGLEMSSSEESIFEYIVENFPSFDKALEPIADFLWSIGIFNKRSLGVKLFIERPSSNHSTRLIRDMVTKLLQNVVEDMKGDVAYMQSEDFSEPDSLQVEYILKRYVANQNQGTVYIMNKLASLLSAKEGSLAMLKSVLETFNKNGPVAFVGTKEELDFIKNTLGILPNFYSNTDIEFTIDEAKAFATSELNHSTNWSNIEVKSKDLDGIKKLLDRGWKLNANAVNQIVKVIHENIYEFVYHREKFDLTEKLDMRSTSELKLKQFVGMQNVKDKVEELEAYLHFQRGRGMKHSTRLHMVLEGSPGTGKTVVAREIARILYNLGYIRQNKLTEVAAEDLASQYVGMSAIKTNNLVRSAMGGVLFIDEAYALVKNKHGDESLASLIKLMEDSKEDLIVIFAGYEKEMEDFLKVNPGLNSRIAFRFKFEDYTPDELVEILKQKVENDSLEGSEEFYREARRNFETASQEEGFGNGRYVEKYLQQKIMQHSLEVFRGERQNSILLIAESEKNQILLKVSS